MRKSTTQSKKGRKMSIRLLFVIAMVLALMIGSAATAAADALDCDNTEIPKSECEALVALYKSTGGPGWTNNTDWLATNTPCSWYGVDCEAGHATQLLLPSNDLSGEIPSEVGDLSNLSTLDLSSNLLSGSIPPELGKLGNLQYLDLYNNDLSGSIPQSFTQLSKVSRFIFSNTTLCVPDNTDFAMWLTSIDYVEPSPWVDWLCLNPSPTSAPDCKKDGWQFLFRADSTAFENQRDCIQYVKTGK
jgi:hypothetical protein